MGKPSSTGQLTLWSEASPSGKDLAKTCRAPAKARASSTATAPGSGARCDASSESADPVGFSLRTCLLSELAGLTSFSLIWKRSATPAGRSWLVLGRSARRTDEIACGSSGALWGTPLANHANGTPEDFIRRKVESVARGNSMGISLSDLNMQVQAEARGMWPTPQAFDAKECVRSKEARERAKKMGGCRNLREEVRDWPTPTRNDGDNDTLPPSQLHGDSTVGAVMRGLQDQASRSTSGKSQDWPTPRASREGAPDSHGKAPIRGVLNAKWVAQLMGYPPDWCDLPSDTTASLFARTATPSFRKSSKRSDAGS